MADARRPTEERAIIAPAISIMDAPPDLKAKALDQMEQECRRLTIESQGDLDADSKRDRTLTRLTRDVVREAVESVAREIMASRGTADEAWDDGDFAAVIADGVAEKLAESTLSPEILARIERSLREAFISGALWSEGWVRSPHGQSREEAAAEYARSKTGR